jgi:hypothetical protein
LLLKGRLLATQRLAVLALGEPKSYARDGYDDSGDRSHPCDGVPHGEGTVAEDWLAVNGAKVPFGGTSAAALPILAARAEGTSHERNRRDGRSGQPADLGFFDVAIPWPPVTLSEEWFDDYLATNGYLFEVEPDLGVRTRPDRLIERVCFEAICEIKEFTTDAMRRRWPMGGRQIGSFSGREWFLPVRRTIGEAAVQLEPLAGDERPLVIVLANPNGVAVPLGDHEVIEAMYGELTVTFRVDTGTGAPATEPEWVLGEGGRLADVAAPWVSAVAVLRWGDHQIDWQRDWIEDWKAKNWPEEPKSTDEALARWEAYRPELERALAADDTPSGEYFYVAVVETISHEAVPLPREMFDGERDRRWVFNPDESRYELLSP